IHWLNHADGAAGIKCLTQLPGATLIFHILLAIATGHVQTYGIAINMAHGIGNSNVLTALAQGDNQFNFIMKVFCFRGIRNLQDLSGLPWSNCIRWLIKEKWALALGVITHFT